MTRCAYCGDIVSGIGPYNPMSGEPVCKECAESPAYIEEERTRDDHCDDERERLWEIAHDA